MGSDLCERLCEVPTLNLEVTESGTHAEILIPEIQVMFSHKKRIIR
jgi:hypothetical protein